MPTASWMLGLGLAGGIIGAGAGYADSENNTATGKARDAIFGGLLGASAGIGLAGAGYGVKRIGQSFLDPSKLPKKATAWQKVKSWAQNAPTPRRVGRWFSAATPAGKYATTGEQVANWFKTVPALRTFRKHPYLWGAAGLVGAGLGLSSMGVSAPGTPDNLPEPAQSSSLPMSMRHPSIYAAGKMLARDGVNDPELMASTSGLVQGLHRSRH